VTGRNVVLTGFMGTGKTTVGRLLAAELAFELVDTDALIEERHGPIAEIFASRGEAAFRAIEREIAGELAGRTGLVIATGGRMLLDPANAAVLGAQGRVFCLVAAPEEVYTRVSADRTPVERPLLAVPDPRRRIEELMAERAAGYGQFRQIPTDGRTPADVAAAILALLDV
jgi:shikimate kinase